MNGKFKIDASEVHTESESTSPQQPPLSVPAGALPAPVAASQAAQIVVSPAASYPRQVAVTGGASPALHSLRRRWPLMFCTGLVCAAALATSAWLIYQPKFRAYASLRIHSETPRLAFKVNESEQAAQFEVFKRTQRELVLGDDVLLAALRDKKLAESPLLRMTGQSEDPVIWLRKQLRVEFPGDAEIMSISMEGDTASFIANAINAVLDAYVENVVNAGKQHRSDRLAELRKVLSVQEEKARRLRSKLESLTESLGSGDTGALGVKQEAAIQRFSQLQTQHGQVQFDRLRAELKIARLADQLGLAEKTTDTKAHKHVDTAQDKAQTATGIDATPPAVPKIPSAQIELMVQKDSSVLKQQEILNVARQSLEHIRAMVRDEQGTMTASYRSRVEQEEQILGKLKESIRKDLESNYAQEAVVAEQNRRLDLKRQFDEAQSDLRTLQQQEKLLADKLAESTETSDKIGTSSVNVELTRKELERLDGINGRLSDEIETLTIELSSASRIESLSRAREPQARSQQDRVKKAASFGVLGFVLPCFGLIWLDARRKLISGAMEIHQLSTIRLLGSIPIVRRRRDRNPRSRRDAVALREAVDRIRTVLLREAELSDYRVVQITSAVAGEGKTTFACQLATSLARAHRRTVLVDFDMRRPSVHEVFGASNEKGICELLRGESSLEKALQATDQKELWLMSAGKCDRSALEGLAKDVVDDVVVGLREQFEFVIIDSSPVLPVVDALLVAQRSDATIITALRDKSCTPQLQESEERLRQIGANVIGSVVTTKEDQWYGKYRDHYAVS